MNTISPEQLDFLRQAVIEGATHEEIAQYLVDQNFSENEILEILSLLMNQEIEDEIKRSDEKTILDPKELVKKAANNLGNNQQDNQQNNQTSSNKKSIKVDSELGKGTIFTFSLTASH